MQQQIVNEWEKVYNVCAALLSVFIMAFCFWTGHCFEVNVLLIDNEINFRQTMPWLVISTLTAMQLLGTYGFGRKRMHEIGYSAIVAALLVSLGMHFLLPGFDISCKLSLQAAALSCGIQIVLLALWTFGLHTLYFTIFPKKSITVISPCWESSVYCADKIDRHSREFYVVSRTVPETNDLDEIIRSSDAVALYKLDPSVKDSIYLKCLRLGKQAFVIPDSYDLFIHSGSNFQFGDMIALRMGNFGLTFEQRLLKRFFDIAFSLVALLASGWLIHIFALLIFLQDRGNPFYHQTRLTLHGKPFRIYKLRTMEIGAEEISGPVLSGRNDARVTRLGRFLRRFKLDEFPQWFNVLKGDLSVVGPRPERPHFFKEYVKEVPEFTHRLVVRAGVTGMAHVYGRYGTVPRERLNLDLYYILNYSFILDMRIIIETVRIMLTGDVLNDDREQE